MMATYGYGRKDDFNIVYLYLLFSISFYSYNPRMTKLQLHQKCEPWR